MMDRKEIISGLEMIVADDKIWRRADYYATVCKEALGLIKAIDVAPEELERLKKCRHACKIECLLEHYDAIKAQRDELLKWKEDRVRQELWNLPPMGGFDDD